MEDALQQLLDAELQAEHRIKQALEQREAMTREALEEARLASARFDAQIPEIRESFMQKAKERAQQHMAEMQLRYQERSQRLQHTAHEAYDDALQDALAIVLDPQQP